MIQSKLIGAPFGVRRLDPPSSDRVVPIRDKCHTYGVTNVAWTAYNQGDEACSPSRSGRAGRRRRRRAGRHLGALGPAGVQAAPRGVRLVRPAARLREVEARRFVGPYGLGGQVGVAEAMPGRRAADRSRGTRQAGRRLLGHERPGGGRRRARPGEDERQDALHRRATASSRGRRQRREAAPARHAHARRTPGATSCSSTATGCSCSRAAATGSSRCPRWRRGSCPYQPTQSMLTEVDVSDPSRCGSCDADARRLVRGGAAGGLHVRIVVSSQVPRPLPFVQPDRRLAGRDRRRDAHATRAVVASSQRHGWLPSYRIKRAGQKAGQPRPLVQCRHVRHPAAFSGLGMLTVLTVDLAKGLEPVDSAAVMTDGRIVYASPESLYVATERWADRPDPARRRRRRTASTTEIHKFDISSPAKTQYRGSGTVSGYLLSQWSLSEYHGVLRVVSTDAPGLVGRRRRRVGVVPDDAAPERRRARPGRPGRRARQGRARLRRALRRRHRLRRHLPPGRPAATRSTSRDPAAARARRAEDPRLLRLPAPDRRGPAARRRPGRERRRPPAAPSSRSSTSPTSRKPTRLARSTLGQGWSEAESDHHAFLFWPPTGLVVIPFEQGAVGFRVGRAAGSTRSAASSTSRRRRSAVRSSSATACSPSPRTGSRRAASRRSRSAAGPRSHPRSSTSSFAS